VSWRRKSYEVLPALSIRGPELRRALRKTTVAWMFGIVWMSVVAGSRVNIFGRMVGFSDIHFGLLSALPFIASFGQLIAAVVIERTGLTKQQFLFCGTVHRMLWLAVAAVPAVAMLPFLPPLPSAWAVYTVLVVLLVSCFMAAMMMPAWLTWMGDMIPRRIRGRYFANRTVYSQAVRIPVVIALAIWLDHMTDPGKPVTAADQPQLLWAICAVFAVAAIFGTIDILYFRNMREVIRTTRDRPRQPAIDIRVSSGSAGGLGRWAQPFRYLAAAVRQLLIDPLRDTMFRRYVLVGATITFSMTVAGPFFWRQALECLKFSQVGADFLFLVLGPLVHIAAIRVWGRLVDRWGRRPVLMIGSAFTVFSLTPYFLASPHTPNPQFVTDAFNWICAALGGVVDQPGWQPLSASSPVGAWLIMTGSLVLGGCGWSGITLAQNNILLGFSDGSGRSKYVAASAVLISLGGIVGGITGGLVAGSIAFLQETPIIVGPFLWNNWHATFLLALLARIVTLVWIARMPDPGSRKIRDIVRVAGGNVYNFVAPRLFYSLRVFGWGRARRNDKQR